jgi:hypothetical protein
MSSAALSIGTVGAARTVDQAAISAGGGTELTTLVTSVHVDTASPLESPEGTATTQPNLTSLIDVAQGTALLAPEHIGHFVSHSRVGTVDLGIPFAYDAAEIDVATLDGFLGTDRPATGYNAGAAPPPSETPAPEPTTYAWMLMSLGIVAWLKLHGR